MREDKDYNEHRSKKICWYTDRLLWNLGSRLRFVTHTTVRGGATSEHPVMSHRISQVETFHSQRSYASRVRTVLLLVPSDTFHSSLVPYAGGVVVIGTLVVNGDAIRVVGTAVHAGATVQLVHLRPGAGTASEIGVTTDGSEGSRAGSEVVIRDGLETTVAMLRSISSVGTVAVTRRVEGLLRRARAGAVEAGETVPVVGGGLPIDGLHPVLEAGRGLELPLANDGPADEDDTNGTGDGHNDDESRLGDLGRGGGRARSLSSCAAGRVERGGISDGGGHVIVVVRLRDRRVNGSRRRGRRRG